jgi:hypothetical protein
MTARWELNHLGPTGLKVSSITLGGAPLGSMPDTFGYEVAERDAIDLVCAILDSDIRTIDTSNGYSDGRSEARIGKAIAEYGGLPDDVVVMTKVDAKGSDYSGDRVRRSLGESRERLGIGSPGPDRRRGRGCVPGRGLLGAARRRPRAPGVLGFRPAAGRGSPGRRIRRSVTVRA